MTATTVKSENITNIEASPIVVLNKKTGQMNTNIDQIALATTSLDETGDKSLICAIPSNAVILDLLILNDDLDTGSPALAVDIGLAYSGIGGKQEVQGNASGDVIDIDLFSTAATSLQAANTAWASVRYEADDIVDLTKQAWEAGGLSSDPGGLFYVSVTVTTAAGTAAAGDLVMRVTYI